MGWRVGMCQACTTTAERFCGDRWHYLFIFLCKGDGRNEFSLKIRWLNKGVRGMLTRPDSQSVCLSVLLRASVVSQHPLSFSPSHSRWRIQTNVTAPRLVPTTPQLLKRAVLPGTRSNWAMAGIRKRLNRAWVTLSPKNEKTSGTYQHSFFFK